MITPANLLTQVLAFLLSFYSILYITKKNDEGFRCKQLVEYPYVYTVKNLRELLKRLNSELGVPDKFDSEYLLSIGYRSHNDRSMIKVLKFVGFLDADGKPSENYNEYRNKDNSEAVMATRLRTSYSELFKIYPDAYNKDGEALRNFFRTHTKGGESVLSLIVSTFTVLCEFADFEAEGSGETLSKVPVEGVRIDLGKGKRAEETTAGHPIVINLNVQLQLPLTEDTTIYDRIFQSLKKNLLEK